MNRSIEQRRWRRSRARAKEEEGEHDGWQKGAEKCWTWWPRRLDQGEEDTDDGGPGRLGKRTSLEAVLIVSLLSHATPVVAFALFLSLSLSCNSSSCLFPSYSHSFPRSSFCAFPACVELRFHAQPKSRVAYARRSRNNRLGPKRSANNVA